MYNSIYPKYLRRRMACRRALRMVFHLLLILSMGTLLWVFWLSWSIACIKELNMWLSVYCAIEILHTLTRFTQVLIWLCANDPEIAETRLTLFFKFWVYLFEAIWVIYGSTFIYSDKVASCDETAKLAVTDESDWSVDHVETLRIAVIVLLVIGYLVWIWIISSFLFACAVYKLYTTWTQMDRTTSSQC